eukprot:scpid23294/ scgid27739/ Ras-related protein RABE1e; Ras-related protein Rab8E
MASDDDSTLSELLEERKGVQGSLTDSIRLHDSAAVQDPAAVVYKVILIGEQHAGKTSLFLRMCDRDISLAAQANGLDFIRVERQVDDAEVKVHYFDTAGLDTRKYSLSNQFYRNSDAILLVYNILDETSITSLSNWSLDAAMQCSRPYISFLVGTRSDLAVDEHTTHISKETAQTYAERLQCVESHRVSSQTGDGVEELLLSVARHLKEANMSRPDRQRSALAYSQSRELDSGSVSARKKCCS